MTLNEWIASQNIDWLSKDKVYWKALYKRANNETDCIRDAVKQLESIRYQYRLANNQKQQQLRNQEIAIKNLAEETQRLGMVY